MDERVWEKTAQFLKELRCEDTGRLSQLQLPEYQKAMKEKFSYQPIYEQTVCEMTDARYRQQRMLKINFDSVMEIEDLQQKLRKLNLEMVKLRVENQELQVINRNLQKEI